MHRGIGLSNTQSGLSGSATATLRLPSGSSVVARSGTLRARFNGCLARAPDPQHGAPPLLALCYGDPTGFVVSPRGVAPNRPQGVGKNLCHSGLDSPAACSAPPRSCLAGFRGGATYPQRHPLSFATQLSGAFVPIASAYDDASIERSLTWAQSFVETYCNRSESGGFDLVADEVAYVDPASHARTLLPNVPVVAISSVEVLSGGQWIPVSGYAFVAETGLIYGVRGVYPGGIRVTYDHGYAVVPQPLIDTACRVAHQYLENPALKLARQVGDMQDTFFGGYSTGANIGAVGIVLNALDRSTLDRFTLPSAA